MRLAMAGLLFLALAACSSNSKDTDPPAKDIDLKGLWHLTEARIAGKDQFVPAEAALTLVFSERGDQAHAGCTVASLAPSVDGSSVRIHEVGRGFMRSCPIVTPSTPLDDRYLDAVTRVEYGARFGSQLVLTGPETVLTYSLSLTE